MVNLKFDGELYNVLLGEDVLFIGSDKKLAGAAYSTALKMLDLVKHKGLNYNAN